MAAQIVEQTKSDPKLKKNSEKFSWSNYDQLVIRQPDDSPSDDSEDPIDN